MTFLHQIVNNLYQLNTKNAFCINDEFFSYDDLRKRVETISFELNKPTLNSKKIAIHCTNNINTYASIIACWCIGCAYIPLGLHNPVDRNNSIIEESEVDLILTTIELNKNDYKFGTIINTSTLNQNDFNILGVIKNYSLSNLAYILFTSGSTGKPKGVTISHNNLAAFLESFKASSFKVNADDNCLQMFELTFDVSVSSYLPALVSGACIYTISDDGIKYVNVLKTLNKYQLTSIQIVPSIIRLGMPLLPKLKFESVKQCILTGEATSIELLEKWFPTVPNAEVFDFYGPTECTIYCSFYKCQKENSKHYNGMICIGKNFESTELLIVDNNLNEVATNEKGEMLIASNQLTNGYFKNEEKNNESFIKLKNKRYYRSGDMCYKDEEGDIYYCGRLDNQVKIQGFRVELSEIEFKVKSNFSINNVVSVYTNKQQTNELILVLETKEENIKQIVLDKLKQLLPTYMIPSSVLIINELPVNTSGKTDRVKVKEFVAANV